MSREKFQYRVVYQREDLTLEHPGTLPEDAFTGELGADRYPCARRVKDFATEAGARRRLDFLRHPPTGEEENPHYSRLPPLRYARIERRPIGDWETIEEHAP